jgi:hypothetical protein
LKPKPVKKAITSESISEEGDNLVIQSKEYKNKNTAEEIKEEKPVKAMKLTRNREEKVEVENPATE